MTNIGPLMFFFYRNKEPLGIESACLEDAFGHALHVVETGQWAIEYSGYPRLAVTAMPHHGGYDAVEQVTIRGVVDVPEFWEGAFRLLGNRYAVLIHDTISGGVFREEEAMEHLLYMHVNGLAGIEQSRLIANSEELAEAVMAGSDADALVPAVSVS